MNLASTQCLARGAAFLLVLIAALLAPATLPAQAAGSACDSLRIQPVWKGNCCYDFTLTNQQTTYWVNAVQANLLGGSGVVTSASGGFGTTTTTSGITWNFPNNLPGGSTVVGGCFASTSGMLTIEFVWMTQGRIACRDTVRLDCNVQPSDDSCKTDTLRLNTGWNHTTNAVDPVGAYSGFWTVIGDPSPNTNEPRPATTITKHPAWGGPLPSSQWMSSYPSSSNDTNGTYTFEACFCVAEKPGKVRLVCSLLADDRARLYINGTQIGATPLSWAFLAPATSIDVDVTQYIKPGRNCIQVEVDNTNNVAMGFDLSGYITSSSPLSFDKPQCCDPRGTIMGAKFWDKDCDGKRGPGEPGLAGWTIKVTDGTSTWSAVTDALGNYYFTNLPPNTYTVSEVNQAGWTQSYPSTPGTWNVNLAAGQVIANRDFGNCRDQISDGCFQIVEDTVVCKEGPNGQSIYVWCFRVKNLSQCKAFWFDIVPPSGVSVSPTPVVIGPLAPGATSAQFCVSFSGPGAVPGWLGFTVRMCDRERLCCCSQDVRIKLPECPKRDCCSDFRKGFARLYNSASASGFASFGGLMVAAGPAGAPIVRVEATITGVSVNGLPAYGYFQNGTISNPFGTTSGVTAPYGHELIWPTIASGVSMSTPTGFSLQVKLPPMAPGAWKDVVSYCIRFRFTDRNCVTCDTLVCVTRKRVRFISWNPHLKLGNEKKGERLASSAQGVVSGYLTEGDSGRMEIAFPEIPSELGSGNYVGLRISAIDATLTDVRDDDDAYDFLTVGGVAAAEMPLQGGNQIGLSLTYDPLGDVTGVEHLVTFRYVLDEAPLDTLEETLPVVLRRRSLEGGDRLTPTLSDLTHLRTYAIHLENANGSEEEIARMVLTTEAGVTIVAVGPTANDTAVAIGFRDGSATAVVAIDGVERAVEAGASIEPIYVTLAGVDGAATTIRFRTLNAAGQTISEGSLLLESPLSSVERGEDGMTGSMAIRSYPNPTTDAATIAFRLGSDASAATLTVSDASGRELLRPIAGERLHKGEHALWITTRDLPAGSYMARLEVDGRVETTTIVVVR